MNENIDELVQILKPSGSKLFHDSTKIKSFDKFQEVSSNSWPQEWKTVFYKAYPRFKQVILPYPQKQNFDLKDILLDRKSSHAFSGSPIELPEFSNLLYFSAGLKRILTNEDSEGRFYPSAGARYPLEIYPAVLNVRDIKKGIYHYHLKTHSLESIVKSSFINDLFKQFSQQFLKKASTLFIVTAVFGRTESKYKNRGYRHIMTEYGHLAQNFYLISSALNLGICSVGGFVDNGINALLDIDQEDESVVGVIAIGNKS